MSAWASLSRAEARASACDRCRSRSRRRPANATAAAAAAPRTMKTYIMDSASQAPAKGNTGDRSTGAGTSGEPGHAETPLGREEGNYLNLNYQCGTLAFASGIPANGDAHDE